MDSLGRYELIRLLGEGGQGHVYEARVCGPQGDRRVALKVLTGTGDALRREARLGGLLRHPNLVDVYEVDQVDGTWFCAMELCGGSLAAHLPLPPAAVVEVGLQVCGALAYAHDELGLVHLDLKPENLLLKGATVKVADLGIARAHGFEDDGRPRGTRGYMAPERIEGAPVDARADLYSLGIVLLQLASGRRPSSSETFSFTGAPTEVQAPDQPGLVPWLAPVVERCLAADPRQRFASARALAVALSALDAPGDRLAELFGPDESTAEAPSADWVVGRGDELARIAEAVREGRCVTLKGPAGIGKTTLAKAASQAWSVETGHPSFVCDLVAASDLDGVLGRVAEGLRLPLDTGGETSDRIGGILSYRGPLLLLLDNAEHVIEAVTELWDAWRGQAPHLRVLATSRRPVTTHGEQVLQVGPLDAEASVEVLVHHAMRRGHDIRNDPAVQELAARLGGVPLALELAAGRIGVLSPAEVLERMGLSILRSGAAGRHETLASALEWSWALLDDPERRLLSQLSVFRREFTVEAVEAVASGIGDPSEVLGRLLDHSWVTPRQGRFTLLESVREFARERLEDPAEPESRLGRWLADRFENAGTFRDTTAPLPPFLADDLLQAGDRALDRGDLDLAVTLALTAAHHFSVRGPADAPVPLLDALIARTDLSTEMRLRCLYPLSRLLEIGRKLERASRVARDLVELARATGDRRASTAGLATEAIIAFDLDQPDEVVARAVEAEAEAEAAGDRDLYSLALNLRGLAALRTGHLDQARELLERVAALDPPPSVAMAVASNLGLAAKDQGRSEDARIHLERAVALARRHHSPRDLALAMSNLALVLSSLQRTAEAQRVATDGLEVARRVGDLRTISILLDILGECAAHDGRPDDARALLEDSLLAAKSSRSITQEATVLNTLASLAGRRGDTVGQLAYLEASVAAWDRMEPTPWGAMARGQLGGVHLESGNPELARTLLRRAVDELGTEYVLPLAHARLWLAMASHACGDPESALELVTLAAEVLVLHPRAAEDLARAEALRAELLE